MKFTLIALLVLTTILACSSEDHVSRIYYFGRQAPGVNLFSVDLQKNILRHTIHNGARDLDLSTDAVGNIYFTSNRVLPEDRAERSKTGRFGKRRQDVNVFYLAAGQLEKDTFLAQPLDKTDIPESQVSVSRQGDHLSFVRTLLPEAAASNAAAANATEEIYVKAGIDGEAKKIHTASIIVKPQWSPDGSKLVFAAYDYPTKTAQVLIYHWDQAKVEVLLDNPLESFQIDSPQWSPDGKRLSLIAHPIGIKANRMLYVLDMGSKELVKLSPDNASVQAPVSWGRKGKQILYGALVDYKREWSDAKRTNVYEGSSQIFISKLDGSTRQLTQGDNEVHANPVFSPDNKQIAYIYTDSFKNRKASLRLMDATGKQLDTLAENLTRSGYLIWQ